MSKRSNGFTIIELVGVLVCTAILAAVAIPRFWVKSVFDVREYRETVQGLLHYAQKVAIAQHRSVYVILNSGTPYVALCFDPACAPGNQVMAAAGSNSGSAATLAACGGATNKGWACEGGNVGTTLITSPAMPVFFYSNAGRPYAANNAAIPRLTITVANGSEKQTLYVEPETGYVYHP